MTSPTDDLARLRELSERATQGRYVPLPCPCGDKQCRGSINFFKRADVKFLASVAIWFRATHVKGKADE